MDVYNPPYCGTGRWLMNFCNKVLKLIDMTHVLQIKPSMVTNVRFAGMSTIQKYLTKKTEVVTKIIQVLENKFGKMTVTRGKLHNFVGMDVQMTDDREVKKTMDQYIKECIMAYGESSIKAKKTPAKHDLFDVDSKARRLNKEYSELFHHIVAKLLFVAKRARFDIDTAISFLCTRVSKSTLED